MIVVEARILNNELTVKVDNKEEVARPSGWNQRGVGAAVRRFLTLKYELVSGKGEVTAHVRYDDLRDTIHIQRGEEKVETVGHMFKPAELMYNGRKYLIHEKMTGGVFITTDGKVVAEGKCGMKSVTFSKYDREVAGILKELAVGYCIKMLTIPVFL